MFEGQISSHLANVLKQWERIFLVSSLDSLKTLMNFMNKYAV